MEQKNYDLFLKFIELYKSNGYIDINRHDPLIQELEKMNAANKQFFYFADLLKLKILFTSMGCLPLIGVEPEVLDPHHFMTITHPDDLHRLDLAKSKLLRLANELFVAEKGSFIISANLRMRNGAGNYSNYLIQGYLFYTTVPYKTVFFLKIHTNIDHLKKIKHGYHYYIGSDFSYFRYPDRKLINTGNVFTSREFEIIQLIASGLGSEAIAKKLNISINTVNTHRSNILAKSGKVQVSELIYELKEQAFL